MTVDGDEVDPGTVGAGGDTGTDTDSGTDTGTDTDTDTGSGDTSDGTTDGDTPTGTSPTTIVLEYQGDASDLTISVNGTDVSLSGN